MRRHGADPAPWLAAARLSLHYAAYLSEVFRGGIQSIAKGQSEAALSLGLSRWLTFRKVVLPQAFRVVLPTLGATIASKPEIFARADSPRPGGLFDHLALLAPSNSISAPFILAELLQHLQRKSRRGPHLSADRQGP